MSLVDRIKAAASKKGLTLAGLEIVQFENGIRAPPP